MIDLHTHTTASDGTDELAELLAKARALRLDCLALTDHDVLPSIGADAFVLPGIEVSARGGVHVLGYFFAPPRAGFAEWLAERLVARRERNTAIAERLQKLGVGVTLEEAEALGAKVTCRPHFARLLLRKGHVQSIEEAFRRYLGEDAPAYVERRDPEPEDAVERVRAAGGLTSLAHPIRLRMADEERFVARLARAGLSAVEAFHSDQNATDTARYLAIANRLGLGVTGGSDYHGANKPAVALGCAGVPSALLDDLRRRAADL